MSHQQRYIFVPLFLLGPANNTINNHSNRTMHITRRRSISRRRMSLLRIGEALRALKNPIDHFKPTLQKQLDAAPRSALSWNGPNIRFRGRTQIDDPYDGVWAPSCLHENRLIHFGGPHPFKYLKCHCEHILDVNDSTTEILTPVTSLRMEIFEDRFEDQRGLPVSRYCQLCRECGLTHRGVVVDSRIEFPTMPCVCGKTSDKEPMYFYIGDVASYRDNPDNIAVDLSIKQRLAESDWCTSRRKQIPRSTRFVLNPDRGRIRCVDGS
jgi:hypothetical protein